MALNVGDVLGRLGFTVDARGAHEFERLRDNLDRKTQRPITQELKADVDTRSFQNADRELASVESRAGKSSLSLQRLGKDFRALGDVAGKITAVGVAADLLGNLAAGATAAGAALGPLAGLVGTMPALYSAAGQAVGVVRLATFDLGKAMTAQQQAQDGTARSMKKYQAELNLLTKEQRGFIKEIGALRPEFDRMRRAAQEGLGGVTDGIESARKNAGVLEKGIGRTSNVLGDLAREAGNLLGSRGFGRDLDTQMRRNDVTIRRAGEGGLHLVNVLRDITIASGPLVDWITKGALGLTAWAESATHAARQNGELAHIFDLTRQTLQVILPMARDVGVALFHIGADAYPTGHRLLVDLRDSAAQFRAWTESARGENAIRNYFQASVPAIEEAARLVRDVVKAFFDIGRGENVAPLIRTIRVELLPVIRDLITQTTKNFGPVFIEFLKQAIILFGHLGGSSGPLVAFVTILGKIISAFNSLLDQFPVLNTAIVSIIAIGGIAKALRLTSAITGVSTLIGLLKDARGAAIALGTAEAGAGAAGAAGAAGGAAGAARAIVPAAEGAAGGAASRLAGRVGIAGTSAGVGLGRAGAAVGGITAGAGAAGLLAGPVGAVLAAAVATAVATAISAAASRSNARQAQQTGQAIGRAGALPQLALQDPGQVRSVERAFDIVTGKIKATNDQVRAAGERLNRFFGRDLNDLGQKGVGALYDQLRRTLPFSDRLLASLGRFRNSIRQIRAQDVMDPNAAAQLFSNFNRLRENGVSSIKDLRENMKFNIREITRAFKEGSPSWAREMTRNIGVGISAVRKGMRDGTISAKDGTQEIARLVRQNLGLARTNMQNLSADGRAKLAGNFRSAADAVRDQMKRAGKVTHDGMEQIRTYLDRELQVYGFSLKEARNINRGFTPAGGPEAGSAGPTGTGPVARRARGGWIGAKGMVGRDNVQIAPGVIAARGEWVGTTRPGGNRGVVLNRHQAPVGEAALRLTRALGGKYGSLSELGAAPIDQATYLDRAVRRIMPGGLNALFSRIRRPHHLAGGGEFQGGGGFAGAVAAADQFERAHFRYLWGGGHQASPAPFGPVDCSGAVSYVLQHAGVPIPTMTSGQLMSAGQPGPGVLTVWANPRHTFMRIGDRFFGTSGSNPGGGAGWMPDPGAGYRSQFAVRHFGPGDASALGDFGGGTINAPSVTGGGEVGAAVQQVLRIDAGAATSDLNNAIQTMGLGTGDPGDPGPGASSPQVRAWLAAALRLDGLPASDANINTLAGRVQQESGGDPNAANNWDINAKRGDPSIGLLQTTGSTFRQYMLPGHGNIRNPVDNAAAAIRYMLARYGHLVGAGSGGYESGGAFEGGGGFQSGGRFGRLRALANRQHAAAVTAAQTESINRGIARSVARGEKGIAPYEDRIQRMEREYGQMDRQFGLTDEVLLIEQPDGSAIVDQTAVQARARELNKLIAKREAIRSMIERYRKAISDLLATLREAIARTQAMLRAATGKARAKQRTGYRNAIQTYQARVAELVGTAKDLPLDVVDQNIDLEELRNEVAVVMGTAPKPPSDTGGGGDTTTGGGITPDQQALIDQAENLKAIVARGTFIDQTAVNTLGGITNPNIIGQAQAGPAVTYPGDAGGGVAAPGAGGLAGIVAGAGAGGGNVTIEVHFNTAFAPSPQQAQDAAAGVVQGLGYQGYVTTPRTDLGV